MRCCEGRDCFKPRHGTPDASTPDHCQPSHAHVPLPGVAWSGAEVFQGGLRLDGLGNSASARFGAAARYPSPAPSRQTSSQAPRSSCLA